MIASQRSARCVFACERKRLRVFERVGFASSSTPTASSADLLALQRLIHLKSKKNERKVGKDERIYRCCFTMFAWGKRSFSYQHLQVTTTTLAVNVPLPLPSPLWDPQKQLWYGDEEPQTCLRGLWQRRPMSARKKKMNRVRKEAHSFTWSYHSGE